MPNGGAPTEKQRLESTTPILSVADIKPDSKPNFQSTDKVSIKPMTSAATIDLKKEKESISKGEKKPDQLTGPSIWVKKWVDYTSKYGLGNVL